MDEWIKISDQLPEINQVVVFTCDIDGDFTWPEMGKWNGEHTMGGGLVMVEEYDNDLAPCSHWIPIPDLPYY